MFWIVVGIIAAIVATLTVVIVNRLANRKIYEDFDDFDRKFYPMFLEAARSPGSPHREQMAKLDAEEAALSIFLWICVFGGCFVFALPFVS